MLLLEDNYAHPIDGINYIKESVLGPGGDSDAFHTWFGITCCCSDDKVCLDKNCPCILTFSGNYINSLLIDNKLNNELCVYECSAFCSCSKGCLNKVVQRGPNSLLEIREIKNKGYGVFSVGTILRGSFICEYAGEIIGKSEAITRSKNSTNSKYILVLREHYSETIMETFVDAYSSGNIGRYINHSCDPNSVIIPVRTGCVVPKVALFASKDIHTNEEITYSYSPDGKSLSKTKCYCMSENCKGFLPSDKSFITINL